MGDDLAALVASIEARLARERMAQHLAGPLIRGALRDAGERVALAARAVRGVDTGPLTPPQPPTYTPPPFLLAGVTEVLAGYPETVNEWVHRELKRRQRRAERWERSVAFLLFGVHT